MSKDKERKDRLVPADAHLKRAADAIKDDLIRNSGDRRILVIPPIGIAVGALGYYAGPTGTGELFGMPFGTRTFEQFVAQEAVAYYSRNTDELKRVLVASGVLSRQDETMLNLQTRLGNIQAVNNLILTKLGQTFEEILQRPNPGESRLVYMLSQLPQNIAGRVEKNAGQLVAMCAISAAERGIKMLASVDLTPQEVRSDSVQYGLHASLTKSDNTLTISARQPQTLFVVGPGTATVTALANFLKFPKSIYADKSRFVASLIESTAPYHHRQVGDNIEKADVVTRSDGMEKAILDFIPQIDVAQFAMVHSAPPHILEQTLNMLGRGMKNEAIIVALLPDKVYPSETTFEAFSRMAKAVGLVQSPFLIDGRQVEIYSYPHPNLTPGQEMYDRMVFAGVFRKS